MKMAKRIGLFFATLTLIACSSNTSYNEAELIRKVDSLSQTVSQLSLQVQELNRELNQIGEQQAAVTTTTAVTTTPIVTSKITTRNPKTTTTKKTTPLTTMTTTQETAPPVFVTAEFNNQISAFKSVITDLSADIAVSEVDEDETKRFDQFYLFQEAARMVETEISQYRQAMKDHYDSLELPDDEFVENERQITQLIKALQAVEDQLIYRFRINE